MEPYSDLADLIAKYSLTSVYISAALLFFLTIISLALSKKSNLLKKLLFVGFVSTTVLCTLFLAGSTIYLNAVSNSGGPVHHHADFEIWNCGEEINLLDPEFPSNKIGTPTLHEHSDNRIHLEGVVVNELDESLGNFFRVIGGSFDQDSIVIPTNGGLMTFGDGDECKGNTETELQTFVYKVEGNSFRQTKLADAKNYIYSPEQNVPPGDCIIIELDKMKSKTDKLCTSFEAAKETGRLTEFKF